METWGRLEAVNCIAQIMKLKAHKEHFLYFYTHSSSYCASSKGLIDISWKKGLTINTDNSDKIENITDFITFGSPFIKQILLYFKYEVKKGTLQQKAKWWSTYFRICVNLNII